jgi:hypothetical protein
MSADEPIACSLGAADLEQRLVAIAAVGHLLRFPADGATRRRLEEIVAAEAQCCAFLDLSLSEEGGELLLSIAAPRDAQAVADGFAAAFGSPA